MDFNVDSNICFNGFYNPPGQQFDPETNPFLVETNLPTPDSWQGPTVNRGKGRF